MTSHRHCSLAVVAASLVLSSCSAVGDLTSTTPDKRTYKAVWVNASWSGGRTGTPLSSKAVDPVTFFGSLCPARVLLLENHPSQYAFYPFGTEFVARNTCTVAIYVAYCRTAGSGGGSADVPTCAVDPRETSISNVKFLRIGTTSTPALLALTTPVNFDVNVFWCSDNAGQPAPNYGFNFGSVKGASQLDCVEQ